MAYVKIFLIKTSLQKVKLVWNTPQRNKNIALPFARYAVSSKSIGQTKGVVTISGGAVQCRAVQCSPVNVTISLLSQCYEFDDALLVVGGRKI